MERSLAEQEREIKDLIRRAKGNPDKTGTLRREALRRLIDLTHSPYSNVKILAAGGIRPFFNDFPELEEAAINAVYDLCEDQDPKVRLEGYSAITHVSRLQGKWVKRNADVLVQLLQSDEPEEVAVVRKALSEHLDMDPCVTLGVLCDQIVPPVEPMDQEEQYIRDRLRSLVLSYLTGQARRPVVQSTIGAEDVLINSLLTAIPKLNNADTEIVVKDILLPLPSYKPPSKKGNELLKIIIEKAKASFRTDFEPGEPATFGTMRFYLTLATFLVSEEQGAGAARATDLLRFYCTTLTGKMTLQKFFPDDQVFIIWHAAKALATCENEDGRSRNDAIVKEVSALRKQVVDACPILLEALAESGMTLVESWSSCGILLQGCLRRRGESTWSVPAHLAASLRKIQTIPGCEGGEKAFEEVQSLIRQTLMQPVTVKRISTNIVQGSSSSDNLGEDDYPSLPGPSRRFVPTRPRAERDENNGTGAMSSSSKHGAVLDDSPRVSKKPKQGDNGPSLLSRMGSPVSISNGDTIGKQDQAGVVSESVPAEQGEKREELNILGAAMRSREMESKINSAAAVTSVASGAFTLLDRIQDSDPPIADDDRTRRRRKRPVRVR